VHAGLNRFVLAALCLIKIQNSPFFNLQNFCMKAERHNEQLSLKTGLSCITMPLYRPFINLISWD
jgi:hypothetical protein